MNINYSHVSLNIIYENNIIKLIDDISLEELDRITGSTISKMDLLCKLMKNSSNSVNKYFLSKIFDNHGNISYLDDDECSFNFIINAGGQKGIFLPVLYNQASLNISNISFQLSCMSNISSIMRLYLNHCETDEKNVFIILDVIKYDEILKKENITIDDLSFYGYLVSLRRRKVDFDYELNKCYISLKKDYEVYKNRSGRVNKLLSNIDRSVHKKHMLLSYLNYSKGIQPIENETILLSQSPDVSNLKCSLINIDYKRCDVNEKIYR